MALIDDLISYWKLDEASGDAIDAHGSNDLTDTNTVGAGTGVINNGRDFESSSAEAFQHASNSDFALGDEDFSFSLWVNAETWAGFNRTFISKFELAGSQEYLLKWDTSSGLQIVMNGAARVSHAWSPSTGTWYHLVFKYDAAGNVASIVVDDGTPTTASYSGGITAASEKFWVAARGVFGNPGDTFDGIIDEVGFWKKVLSSDEITELYNGGAGLAYPFSVAGATPKFPFGKPFCGPFRRAVA